MKSDQRSQHHPLIQAKTNISPFSGQLGHYNNASREELDDMYGLEGLFPIEDSSCTESVIGIFKKGMDYYIPNSPKQFIKVNFWYNKNCQISGNTKESVQTEETKVINCLRNAFASPILANYCNIQAGIYDLSYYGLNHQLLRHKSPLTEQSPYFMYYNFLT